MKTVLTNSELPHVWANQLQQDGRNPAKSFFFSGSKIYSYGHHFCIAKILDNDTVLITDRKYSNTTRKHVSSVYAAVSHYKNKIFCPYPESCGSDNYTAWINRINNILPKLATARRPEKYFIQIDNIKHDAEKWARFTGNDLTKDLTDLFLIVENPEFQKQRVEIIKKAHKERIQLQKETIKKQLIEWRNLERNTFTLHAEEQFLRINGDEIETSKGIKFDKNLAPQVYDRIKNGKIGDKVLNYSITEIKPDFVRIGCHKLQFTEINNILNQLIK